jgi:putative ubiquitin-RnfH superfamily antitoxin RatB of RatAB toxin-antitoxin module
MTDGVIRVEIVYATLQEQCLLELNVPFGTTAADAVRSSGILERFPGLDATDIGVFGEYVPPGYRLRAGDRVEIYRPLVADPKDVRRALAKQGKSTEYRNRGGNSG